MPRNDGLPPGTLVLLILQVLDREPMHGYLIARRIAQISSDVLSVEEGSLYPALQKMLLEGWVRATPAVSDTGRAVRQYRLTRSGRARLAEERQSYLRTARGIAAILDSV